MEKKTKSVLCIGAAHWDVRSECHTEIRQGTSNPVTVSRYPGGVAHNVAMNLNRLGVEAGLLSYWGQDVAGDALEQQFIAQGLDVVALPRSEAFSTATYTAVLQPGGELAFGLADMEIYDHVNPAMFTGLQDRLASYPIWFIDTNMPVSVLEALSKGYGSEQFLAADAVSVAKATKLNSILKYLDILFCNVDEASELVGLTVVSEEDIVKAGSALTLKGAKSVVISAGIKGAYIFQGDSFRHFPAIEVEITDVTGAGDSLIAGTLSGIAEGYKLDVALKRGINAASITVKDQGATSENLRDLSLGAIGS
ncbi:carbohydrate kinase family protein [Kiloniella sp. EL199]|uniref:carbohydrate kinase family protein n=1 Tax=Kiloniella sp. EL199 TaxID=2107581 RepID=UPI0013C4817F|nr:carbohydrate kinase family protein [Kiloniella sp. EL199]